MNPKSNKRKIDVLVLSDLHLGTIGCHAKELSRYLRSIDPSMVVLNGDIVDAWNFSKNYFPKSHMDVLVQLLKFTRKGTPVYYLTGNHDDVLRKFSTFRLGNFHLRDKLLLNMNNKVAWMFHGDVFDGSITHARWIAKLGGKGYDYLILLNRLINVLLQKLGRSRISLSQKVKDGVKRAMKHVSDFEQTAAELAADHGYDYVVCGHIHQPIIKQIKTASGQEITYMNSGDWIENLSSLENVDGEWRIFSFFKDFTHTADESITEDNFLMHDDMFLDEETVYVSTNKKMDTAA